MQCQSAEMLKFSEYSMVSIIFRFHWGLWYRLSFRGLTRSNSKVIEAQLQ